MKKLFAIMALLALMPAEVRAESYLNDGEAFTVAKAVKLGRGKSSTIFAGQNLSGNNGGQTIEKKKQCDENCTDCDMSTGKCKTCRNGYYLSDGRCVYCPDNATCNNGETFVCQDYYYKSGNACLGICSKASCIDGYSPASEAKSCCCVADAGSSGSDTPPASCPAGQYLSNGECVACAKTYGPCSECNASQCTKCSAGYILDGTQCTYYIPYCTTRGNNTAVTASMQSELGSPAGTWITNNCENNAGSVTLSGQDDAKTLWYACVKCGSSGSSSSSSGGTYPNCNSGYWFGPNDNTCTKCPATGVATCSRSTLTCQEGYVKEGGATCQPCDPTCKTCSRTGSAGSGYCTSCPTGKTLSNGICK